MQLTEVQGVVIRQDQIIQECKSRLQEIQRYNSREVLRIQGVIEEEEDCEQQVKDFFKQKLKIQIKIKEAFRVGLKGNYSRAIWVYLSNPRDKGLIFANVKNLKDVVNEEDDPYCVDDQMSAKKAAERN